MIISETDKAYAAGIIDGEGSVCIRRYVHKTPGHHIPSFSLYVEIRMTNREAVEFIHAVFGGCLKSKGTTKTGKVIYDWKIYGNQAADFLRQVIPYLKCKKRQAAIAIRFSEIPCAYGKYNKEEITSQRDNLKSLISRLNQTSHGIKTGEYDDYRTSVCQ